MKPLPSAAELLIVDDEPENLHLLSKILEPEGYRIRVANGGMQALASASKIAPDLILLDLNMPEIDGYEVCRRIKADPDLAGIPILFLSAYTDPEYKIRAFTVGGADYITKPFHAAEVCARVHAHVALGQARRDLLRTKERLELAVLSGCIGIWDWDTASNQVAWDASMYRLYGRRRGEFDGSYASWATAVFPEDLPRVEAGLRISLGQSDMWEGEFRIVLPDGTPRHIRAYSRVIRAADGRALRMVGVNYDITPLKQLEEDLRRLNLQMEQRIAERTRQLEAARLEAESANRSKSIFLSNVSHELRTPLNGILNLAELLTQTPLTAEQNEWLGTLKKSGHALLGMLNTVLDISDIEAGRLQLQRGPVNLRHEVAMIAGLLGRAARDKGLAFAVEVDKAVPNTILGDAVHLRQVIFNLLDNAVKFTNHGTVAMVLEPETRGPGRANGLRLSVRDTGPGIPEAHRPHLFKLFTQLDDAPTRVHGGMGLGLALCDHLVQLMGGRIWMEPNPGGGSVFHAVFPAVTPSAEPILAPAPDSEVRPIRRVLLVDDNPVNLQVAVVLLTRRGHAVAVAKNGAEALAILEKHSFDLILMDVQMPVMDGLEATRRIREREASGAWPRTRIVALTASLMPGDHAHCREAGMDDVITKPFVLQKLFAVIEDFPLEST